MYFKINMKKKVDYQGYVILKLCLLSYHNEAETK